MVGAFASRAPIKFLPWLPTYDRSSDMVDVRACWIPSVHSSTNGRRQFWSISPIPQVPGFEPIPLPHLIAPVGKTGPAAVQLSDGTGGLARTAAAVANVTVPLAMFPGPCVGTPLTL